MSCCACYDIFMTRIVISRHTTMTAIDEIHHQLPRIERFGPGLIGVFVGGTSGTPLFKCHMSFHGLAQV
ncbi:hypothetical protein BDV27DRAFT_120159 [Aspergillus caelatus]|uniref:Uncharacterized protein n=1 Tax=Aspergillus caelatus TaxID=61420 RepID=A0A5N7AJA6_9EURO|nr:uncharacterized protein BDV27DRAFT_120159 [Aspergillus caelatus]KAE8369984.1 hypothetical protein BDV27DRAFT_120159 [Aspergillus caelatus]